MKIKSKRNGLVIDPLPYTETAVRLGNGKFAQYIGEDQKTVNIEQERPQSSSKRQKSKKEDKPTEDVEIL